LVVFVLEELELLEELLSAGAVELGIGDGVVDLVGVVLGDVAAAAGLLGVLRDIAVLSAQDGDGVAKPGEDR
jgi:hypothetical protein